MTELEAKLNQIADNLLVQTTLVERFERPTEERFTEHEQPMDRVEAALESFGNGLVKQQSVMAAHHEWMEDFQQRMNELDVRLAGLSELIDRFIRGHQGDGHASK